MGEALDSWNCIANGCESDPEPPTFAGEALDSRDWIPIGVNQILNPDGRSIG
jgi:hypothetical protein